MKIYLVGGAIRNQLLDLPLKDKDWLVVGSSYQKMIDLGYKKVGRNFPVFLHPNTGEEYALARTERKTSPGYTGFICHASPEVTLEQDLARRDLTINAIAQDQNGKYYDPHGGIIDLQNRKLRHVSSSFYEDPLRVLRVARFSASLAHLNFHIVDETLAIMKRMSNNGELCSLPSERIWKELIAALHTKNPDVFFQVLQLCGSLTVLFPELNTINSLVSKRYKTSKPQIYLHSPMALSIAAKLTTDIDIRFSILLYDLSLVSLRHITWVSYDELNVYRTLLISSLCMRLSVPHALRNFAMVVIKFHHIVDTIQLRSPYELIGLFNKIDAWRKPSRVNKIALVSEIVSRLNSDSINFSYKKSEYLLQAWGAVQHVSIKEILYRGFEGKDIYHELMRRRISMLTKWQDI
ncbi:multifunctional CCA addition/repair protein [Candidatus Erwinia haradaeae]|uniref:CCA-adding enzyme n=1 Tax=Candidatus Erwinia haradaeae TaxID=1922217 RepID=A0A451D7Y3_9GAMM|nr:multifunctional CCA addition/repair protein [Candidatus Erwinia haradaeae]VFP81959.1 Multifunctional CCA protein [Candidatus Erwinia haradaeae]